MSTKRQEVKSKVLQLAKEGKIKWDDENWYSQLKGWVEEYTVRVFVDVDVWVFSLSLYKDGVELTHTILTEEEYIYLSEQQAEQYREREERLQQQAEHQIDEFLNLVP